MKVLLLLYAITVYLFECTFIYWIICKVMEKFLCIINLRNDLKSHTKHHI